MKTQKISLILAVVLIFCTSVVNAKRPEREPAAAVPEVFSVKVEYSNNQILIQGANLASAEVTLAGVPLTTGGSSTDALVVIPFTEEMSGVVDGPGNYVFIISTGGGSFTLTAFIPFAITYLPPSSGPCPCESEWDYYGGLDSPNGFADVDPYCAEESSGGNFVTVQFSDQISAFQTNYWVLWTEWVDSSNSGYCELWLDGPTRILDAEEQYLSCKAYLQDTFVWPDPSGPCLF